MSVKLPNINFIESKLYTGIRNDKGLLCNIYTPLLNFSDKNTKKLDDFTTTKLNFDMEHPVDIVLQDSYDGGVNMILNDGKNAPKLISSRFSVQDENTFKIPDHSGFKDTNIYEENSFEVDTYLKSIPKNIPELTYEGLVDNGGKLSCGSYNFYFKLCDADGNETEVIQESGVVLCHIGVTNDPHSIRMGLLDENSGKAIKFTLNNIDAGFDYVKVYFARSSSNESKLVVPLFFKIDFKYPITPVNELYGICSILITGAEQTLPSTLEEVLVDYADINSVKTQTVCNNVLLFGNVDTPEHDWDAIREFTWKIITRAKLADADSVGNLDSEYKCSMAVDDAKDHGYCYYNTKNVYYRVGYWPDELYRFGIVYIFNDNSLSPVINLQGIDFLSVPTSKSDIIKNSEWTSAYELLFFTEDKGNPYTRKPCYLYEPDDYYFNKTYRTNSRGVFRMPKKINRTIIDICNTKNGVMSPTPLYLNFDMHLIGYKYAKKVNTGLHGDNENQGDKTEWQDVLKKHNIKGFFFVRQKRVPTIISLGVIISHSDKDRGALPVIRNNNGNVVYLSFVSPNRLLYETAIDQEIKNNKPFDNLAMLCPDAELNEMVYNSMFSSAEYLLDRQSSYAFNFVSANDAECNASTSKIMASEPYTKSAAYISRLTNVPEDTHIISDGTNYFSTVAGNPEEPWVTLDLLNIWKKTVPLELTVSNTLVRGNWASYVGLSNPNEKNPKNTRCPFSYGQLYNIKKKLYLNIKNALDLDFQTLMESKAEFFAVTHRILSVKTIDVYRGDCFPSMFTHRMFRNFVDPELPTNRKIVNPLCWRDNYIVRCTAEIITSTHSNLTKDSDGFEVDFSAAHRKRLLHINAGILFLTGNIAGALVLLFKGDDGPSISLLGLSDSYVEIKNNVGDVLFVKGNSGEIDSKQIESLKSIGAWPLITGQWYLIDSASVSHVPNPDKESIGDSDVSFTVTLAVDNNGLPISFNSTSMSSIYPNGMSNEICKAFETYHGEIKFSILMIIFPIIYPLLLLVKLALKKKKLSPKLAVIGTSCLGGNLTREYFEPDSSDWTMHGLAQINRADINAVSTGLWITFPILSNYNLAMRDIDYNLPTEETAFNKKRSFYPLAPKEVKVHVPDSVIINGASKLTIPNKLYFELPNILPNKQEFFTRIHNSYRDNAVDRTNLFKLMMELCRRDYEKLYGSITKLITVKGYVYVIFKHGIGILSMSDSINLALLPLQFLPPVTIISNVYGSIWKDSIIKTNSDLIYGVDSVAKVIWCISGTTVNIISDLKVGKFLIDNIDMSEFNFRPYVGHINIKSHYNAFKKEVMFTYYNDYVYDVKNAIYLDDAYSIDSENYIVLNNERVVEDIFTSLDEMTLTQVILKLGVDFTKVNNYKDYIDNKDPNTNMSYLYSLYIGLPNREELDLEINKYATTGLQISGNYIKSLLYVKAERLLPEYDTTTLLWKSYADILKGKTYKWVPGKTWSLCYNEHGQAFTSFYDWIPLESENIDNVYFSFDRDSIDELNKNSVEIITPDFLILNQSYVNIQNKITQTTNEILNKNTELSTLIDVLTDLISNNAPQSDLDNAQLAIDLCQLAVDSLSLLLISLDSLSSAIPLYICPKVVLKKNLIDSSFTDDVIVRRIKGNYYTGQSTVNPIILDPATTNSLAINITVGQIGCFSMYYKLLDSEANVYVVVSDSTHTYVTNKIKLLYLDLDWHFITVFIRNNEVSNGLTLKAKIIQEPKIINENSIITYECGTYWFAEPKLQVYTGNEFQFSDSYDNIFEYTYKVISKNDSGLFKDFYDIRNTNRSALLWKHGQAGVYDSQGKIKPTNWYGKLHEFNFEFVVNLTLYLLKVFNDLKIISNKTAPNKFEYEIVGEGYDWFKYKAAILWINTNYPDKSGNFAFDKGYELVLSTKYTDLVKDYDFPKIDEFELMATSNPNFIIQLLPYIHIELADKKGRLDRGYHRNTDFWYNLSKNNSTDKFAYNCTEPTIVYDEQLNEHRVHIELLGNDMDKYGRIRGNMLYLEDLWDVEIRPVSFKYAYMKDGQLEFSTLKETRPRDKYIKIKVRYSGEDLAVIQLIITKFDYSQA